MKLLSQIRRYRVLQMPHWVRPDKHAEWNKHAKQMLALIRDTEFTAYNCDEASDYYYTGTDQEVWNLQRDFGPFTPLDQIFWMEHRHPLIIASEAEGNMIPPVRGWSGWLMFGVPKEQVKIEGEFPPGTEKLLVGELFIDYDGFDGPGVVQGPHGTWTMALDAAGRLVERPWCNSFAPVGDEAMVQCLLGWWHPALYALGLLNSGKARAVEVAKDEIEVKL